MKYLGKIKLSTIFRLHEVLGGGGKNYALYSDYMKYLGEKKLSTIFRLHEVLGGNKIVHYIPIT